MSNTVSTPNNRREDDAQLTVTGHLKENDRSSMVVFSFTLALLELTCIVPIPDEGTSVVPVYVKFRIRRG